MNENRDFYADVAAKQVPEFDVMVTNPPFSSDHKERLLQFLIDDPRQRPFFLLLPSWVAQRSYWREFLAALRHRSEHRHEINSSIRLADFQDTSTSDSLEKEVGVFYWCPGGKYRFEHVDGFKAQGRAKAPFDAMWFVGVPKGPNAAKKVRLKLQGEGMAAASLSQLYKEGVLLTKREKKQRAKEMQRSWKVGVRSCPTASADVPRKRQRR